MNAIATTQDTKAVALYSGSSLVPRNMDEAIRLAEFMCRARTLPKHLWDSPGDCLMVVELAMRWGMSPFAVAQATSVISGKQMIEGKLVAAACESVGAIVGQFDYSFAGEGDDRSITVTATRRGETNPRTVTVKLADAKTTNQMWVKQPDQQLVYHGVRVWARRWTPAVILGVYSKEEWGQIIDGEVTELATTDARTAINDAVPLKAAAAKMPRAPRITEPPRGAEEKPLPDYTDTQWDAWIVKLRAACALVPRREELVEMADGKRMVGKALAEGPDWVKRDIDDILAANYKRLAETETVAEDELPDIEIAGAEKMASG